MSELTREEKLKLVEKLPQKLQDFLYSEDTGAFLLYLGQKYNLPDEKIRLLSKLVADVVLGIASTASLAQEISSKIISDTQVATNLTQELNAELLTPAMAPTSSTPTISQPTIAKPVDKYREPASEISEIIDLRNQPKAGPTPPAPALPPKPITPPLTFTHPIEIEADPHKIPTTVDQPKADPPLAGKPLVSATKPIDAYREPIETRPQYIMRPPGEPPTNLDEF